MNLHQGQIDLTREPDFVLGSMTVHPSTREIEAGGIREAIEPRVMQVLVALARRRGEVISRDELIVSCWTGRAVSDDAINRCIARIRRLAETHGGFTLETIPRIGYRLFETPVAHPARQDPGAEDDVSSIDIGEAVHRSGVRHGRGWLIVCFVVLLVGAAGGIAYWLLHAADRQSVPAPRFSIAVLPFSSFDDERQSVQLGGEIASSIADYLSSEGMDVVSPARARRFRGASKADAAQALRADFVVDGEIRRERGTFKVLVRIVDGTSGTTLIAETVRGTDPAVLPEAVATAVLGCGWGWIPGYKPSTGLDRRVVAATMKAVKHLANPSENVYAYDLAEQLVRDNPGDANAQYLHAITAAAFAPDNLPEKRAALIQEARTGAERALRLDPEFGDAYAVLSMATPSFNWADREALLVKGIHVRPTSPIAYMDLLAFRLNAGYLRSAARMAERAYSNHPHFGNTVFEAIRGRLWLGDSKGVRPLIARSMALYPNTPAFAAKMFEATAFAGSLDDAEALLKDPAAAPLLDPRGEGPTYRSIVAALRHGRRADVDAVVDDCLKVSGRSDEFVSICFVALVNLGRLDDAFRMTDLLYPDQRGATAGDIERRWLQRMPFDTVYLLIPATAALRADPRFSGVADRLGLVAFWKSEKRPPDFCAVEKAPVCALLKSS